jgi:hypothetical protein
MSYGSLPPLMPAENSVTVPMGSATAAAGIATAIARAHPRATTRRRGATDTNGHLASDKPERYPAPAYCRRRNKGGPNAEYAREYGQAARRDHRR